MRSARDFRSIAREALRGKWLLAILTGFVASLIGATLLGSGGGGSSGSSSSAGSSSGTSDGSGLAEHLNLEVISILTVVLLVAAFFFMLIGLVTFVIGGAGKFGYAQFNLHLVDGKEARFSDLFSQFHRLGDGFVMYLLVSLYTFLWTLLFIIPGIIKSYSYAMTPYILSEHPEYNANFGITLSREMMNGNKFRLFCLHLSFIGWDLLTAVPTLIAIVALAALGVMGFLFTPLILLTVVGNLCLHPYKEAAQAAFYREVSGTEIPADASAQVLK